MSEQEALETVRVRARDFISWAGKRAPRLSTNPMNMTVQEAAQIVTDLFPVVAARHKEWQQGGWKRAELDEAFVILHLPPLPFA